jgi:hypothetical protein
VYNDIIADLLRLSPTKSTFQNNYQQVVVRTIFSRRLLGGCVEDEEKEEQEQV